MLNETDQINSEPVNDKNEDRYNESNEYNFTKKDEEMKQMT